jgi:peptidoglycan/xylan/chitin deacetylase (PgdA/CDA1 family)
MKLPGVRATVRMARWIRSRVLDSALILGYHRIDEFEDDPYSLRVSVSHFAEQLSVLRRESTPISLQQLLDGLANGQLPHHAVVLTFDDGYAGMLHYVKPLLERFEIPATVFVTTGCMGREFWWDRLAGTLRSAPDLPEQLCLSIPGRPNLGRSTPGAGGSMPDLETQHKILRSLYERLLPLAVPQRDLVLNQLAQQVQNSDNRVPFDRSLTPEEVIELAKSDMIEIGAHTVTHPVLKALPVAQQRWEIHASKGRLEELLAKPVSSFSFPNGSSDGLTRAMVKEAGFTCACASVNDVTWRGSDRFWLPRFWIPDWAGVRFAAWLKHWLGH